MLTANLPQKLADTSNQHRGYELIFKGIGVTIDQKPVLQDINGVALPGEMLAIMGPSGAGKTTLLNCLAGRRDIDEGYLTLNSRLLTKAIRRKISYVLQDDTFYPALTCQQTISYTAQLRLPGSMTTEQKKHRIDEIIDALNLRKCLDTKMGDTFDRGLSGGEKKRTNIACELLTDPALMLLDEPTSGLDSSTSYSLIRTLKDFAKKSGKTIVMTIHQPSSKIFHMFDKLLLLCDGQVAYFGGVSHCVSFFSDIGLRCPDHYDFADHILDKLKETNEVKEKIIQKAKHLRDEAWYPHSLKCPPRNALEGKENSAFETKCESISRIDLRCQYTSVPDSGVFLKESSDISSSASDSMNNCDESLKSEDNLNMQRKWPTSFRKQYTVLFERNLRQSVALILSKEQIIMYLIAAIFAGILWFRTSQDEESLPDRQSLLSFVLMFTDFTCMMVAQGSVPGEMPVVYKERLGGYYRLSAYYLAKITSQTLTVLTLPTVLFSIIYWLSGLNYNFTVYIQMLLIMYISNLISQSVGFLFGYLITDPSLSSSISHTIMVCILLSGGFFISNLPIWAKWVKYVSFMSLVFNSLIEIDLSNTDIRCSKVKSSFPACINSTDVMSGSEIYIPRDDLLNSLTLRGEGWYFWHYLLILTGVLVFNYVATYIVLRVKKPVSGS